MVEKSREEKHMVIYSVVDAMVGGHRVLLLCNESKRGAAC